MDRIKGHYYWNHIIKTEGLMLGVGIAVAGLILAAVGVLGNF
jgi:hypothetical protein